MRKLWNIFQLVLVVVLVVVLSISESMGQEQVRERKVPSQRNYSIRHRRQNYYTPKRVEIKVYRGPAQLDDNLDAYAPWGYYVKQPLNEDY